jgi:DNA end-binding protein Ku
MEARAAELNSLEGRPSVESRSCPADEYFDEIQDVNVTKDMLDLAKHIVNQKSGRFEPEKFEDHYETALVDLINQKRAGKPITPKERPKGENVVDLMEALRRSVGGRAAETTTKSPGKTAKMTMSDVGDVRLQALVHCKRRR